MAVIEGDLGFARLRRLFRNVVVVEVQVALHKKHGQEPHQHPRHRTVRRAKLFPRMGHQMEDSHSQH